VKCSATVEKFLKVNFIRVSYHKLSSELTFENGFTWWSAAPSWRNSKNSILYSYHIINWVASWLLRMVLRGGVQHHREKFSKVSSTVISCSKLSSYWTFEKFDQALLVVECSEKFSKVSSIAIWYSKLCSKVTFEKLYQAPLVGACSAIEVLMESSGFRFVSVGNGKLPNVSFIVV